MKLNPVLVPKINLDPTLDLHREPPCFYVHIGHFPTEVVFAENLD